MLALLDSNELNTPSQHYGALHNNPKGLVLVWEREGGGFWHKLRPNDSHIPALLARQQGKKDSFISVNEFHGWRLVKNLKSLRACYADLDGFTDLPIAQELLREAQLPQPSFVIYSGRGLHLYWVHEPIPNRALPVWQKCQDTLIAALKMAGADPVAKDCTRMLRLAGTINKKSGTEARGYVLDSVPYTFHHLCDEILGYRDTQKKEAKIIDLSAARIRKTGQVAGVGAYKRWGLVYQDLQQIANYYFLGGIPEGHRNNWLFLVAVALGWFAEQKTLESELAKEARIWTPGLTAKEVKAAIHAPLQRAKLAAQGEKFFWNGEECDPRYKFKRETLWNLLSPIIPNDLESQLRAIVTTETRATREAERQATRDRVAEGRYLAHKAGPRVNENSIEQQKPWEDMGISRITYYRRKKKGLI